MAQVGPIKPEMSLKVGEGGRRGVRVRESLEEVILLSLMMQMGAISRGWRQHPGASKSIGKYTPLQCPDENANSVNTFHSSPWRPKVDF